MWLDMLLAQTFRERHVRNRAHFSARRGNRPRACPDRLEDMGFIAQVLFRLPHGK